MRPQKDMQRNDFKTHLNYIKTLKALSENLTIEVLAPECKYAKSPTLQNKIKLLQLTKQSIKDDYDIMNMDAEYAVASSAWIPIKAYYLVYHTLCVFHYLTSEDVNHLTLGHGLFKKHFKSLLKNESLKFSQILFNRIDDESILKFTSGSSVNLKRPTHETYEETYNLIMKKQMKTTKANLKSDNKKSKKSNQNKKPDTVCVLDFLYLMRERTNYKNSNFLDGIECKDIKEYCENYYDFISNFLLPFDKFLGSKFPSNL